MLIMLGVVILFSACKPSAISQNSSELLKDAISSTDSVRYREALSAYNDFLNSKKAAVSRENGKTFYITELYDISGQPGINDFTFYDVNNDGVPELHTRSLFYDVYSYQNGQVVEWYNSGSNFMNGAIYPLENGAIFTEKLSTAKEYFYTSFNSEGTATTVYFSFQEYNDSKSFLFGNKTVSSEEWDSLTKEYFVLSQNKADVQWHRYETEKTFSYD